MKTGLSIPYEIADNITLTVLQDQLGNLLRDQRWYETPEVDRFALIEEYGYRTWVHPEDYAKNRDEYIPALKLIIEYFGGTV